MHWNGVWEGPRNPHGVRIANPLLRATKVALRATEEVLECLSFAQHSDIDGNQGKRQNPFICAATALMNTHVLSRVFFSVLELCWTNIILALRHSFARR